MTGLPRGGADAALTPYRLSTEASLPGFPTAFGRRLAEDARAPIGEFGGVIARPQVRTACSFV